MRQSMTAVLERNTTFEGEFATEPYEAAWATEARWFVQILSAGSDGEAGLRVVTQISPDGITWCDYDDIEHVATGVGVTSWPVREFGHWLRVRGEVDTAGAAVTARIYLAVKS
ncbi:hypothetical protein G1H11_23205 [Phytoactinopolyspora alkaliphila]|uniref:Uncharacterized protein n=1 Tax=Phytoactinopolyspora alkaliphila TaxID=1783498 RepID=A0A6N9YT40_9ACTN|nr:hypothetical protein [Phytoactinopolyspora alkaliphila]NED98213.1 hypothetical protein [Phytoactinopolyspora alkaliphila]